MRKLAALPPNRVRRVRAAGRASSNGRAFRRISRCPKHLDCRRDFNPARASALLAPRAMPWHTKAPLPSRCSGAARAIRTRDHSYLLKHLPVLSRVKQLSCGPVVRSCAPGARLRARRRSRADLLPRLVVVDLRVRGASVRNCCGPHGLPTDERSRLLSSGVHTSSSRPLRRSAREVAVWFDADRIWRIRPCCLGWLTDAVWGHSARWRPRSPAPPSSAIKKKPCGRGRETMPCFANSEHRAVVHPYQQFAMQR
jgi:hypothetical protein